MRGLADLRAVEQQPDVMRVGMLAAFFKAVVDGVEAHIAAVFAGMNALVRGGILVFVDIRHGFGFFLVLVVLLTENSIADGHRSPWSRRSHRTMSSVRCGK